MKMGKSGIQLYGAAVAKWLIDEMKYGAEIIEMLFKELTREEDLEISRLDGYDAGYTKGEQAGAERGAAQKQREIAKEMKRENIAEDVIAKVTGLNAEEIEAL